MDNSNPWSDMISLHSVKWYDYHFTGIIFIHGFITLISTHNNVIKRHTYPNSQLVKWRVCTCKKAEYLHAQIGCLFARAARINSNIIPICSFGVFILLLSIRANNNPIWIVLDWSVDQPYVKELAPCTSFPNDLSTSACFLGWLTLVCPRRLKITLCWPVVISLVFELISRVPWPDRGQVWHRLFPGRTTW